MPPDNDKALAKLRKGIGLRIEEIRGTRTRKSVIDAYGKTERTLANWEAGASSPDLAEAILLAKVLGCNVLDFLK